MEEREFECEGNIRHIKNYLVGINITPIIKVYLSKNNGLPCKIVKMSKEDYDDILIKDDRLKALQQMIS